MLQARGSAEGRPRAERVGKMPCAFVKLFGPSDTARDWCGGVEGLRGPNEAAAGLREALGAVSPPRSMAIAEAPPQEELSKRPRKSSAATVGAGPRTAFQSISVLCGAPAVGVMQRGALGAPGTSAGEAVLCRRLNPPEPDGVDGALGGAVGTRGAEDSSTGGGGEGASNVRLSGATASTCSAIALAGRTGLPGRADDLEPGGLIGTRASKGGAAGGASTGADGFMELGGGIVGASGAQGCTAAADSFAGPITPASALLKSPLATPRLRRRAVCASKPFAITDLSVRTRCCSATSCTAKANLPLEAPSMNA